MLPQLLAADLCSLLPDQERYCMCVIAELDGNGSVKRFDVVEGLMRAAAMITYDSAARTLGFTEKPALSPQAEAFKKTLRVLSSVSTKLRRARMKRGALDLDLPEPKLTLDDAGHPTDIQQRTHDPGIKRAYQIVEELMLLANELVARWLGHRHSPAIYRVHGRPDEEKLMRLGSVAEALGAPFDLEALQDPKGLNKWLKRIDKHPRKRVLEGLLLRSLKQAAYDIVNIGHFGLASDAYLHFTSPIRRYPDLLVHRAIKRLLHGGDPELSPDETEELRMAATHSSTRERAAMSVEREIVDLYRALFAKDLIGELLEGTITALVGGGIYVNVDAPFIDVFIPFEGMGPDRYVLSDDELSLIGQRSGEFISLGDTLVFELVDVSILRRTIYGRRIASSVSEDSIEGSPRGRTRQRRSKRERTGSQRRERSEQPRSSKKTRGSKKADRTSKRTRKAPRARKR
jgi:ribonuclease R